MATLELPLLIEPDALADVLDHKDLLLVDLSRPETRAQAYIPNAIFIAFQQTLLGTAPAPGKLPELAALQQLLTDIGLTADKWVVVYDDEGGGWAGRFIWLLDSVGFNRYSYLNGGIHAWLQAGMPLGQEPAGNPEPGDFQVTINNNISVDKAYLLRNYLRDDLVLWDARSPAEYSGIRVSGLKAGHIPGAKNYEWTAAMDSTNGLRLRDQQKILAELTALGITRDKEVITHCQTHHRSGFTYLLGKILGFSKIRAYPGSWSEWSNDPDTPAEV